MVHEYENAMWMQEYHTNTIHKHNTKLKENYMVENLWVQRRCALKFGLKMCLKILMRDVSWDLDYRHVLKFGLKMCFEICIEDVSWNSD